MKLYRGLLKTVWIEGIILMAFGAAVRALKAGLACPDWPLCFGQIIPDLHFGTWLEFLHRAFAGLLSILFLFTYLYGLFSIRKKNPEAWRKTNGLLVSAGLVLLMQIVFGAITVLLLVKPIVVTGHLILALIFVSLVYKAQINLDPNSANAPKQLPLLFWILLPLFWIQYTLGGLVAATYSGLACPDWPLCHGQFIPTIRGEIGMQVMHRLTAYLIVIITALMFWQIKSKSRVAVMPLALVSVQLVIGVCNVIFHIPPLLTVLHQTVAVLFWLSLVRLKKEST